MSSWSTTRQEGTFDRIDGRDTKSAYLHCHNPLAQPSPMGILIPVGLNAVEHLVLLSIKAWATYGIVLSSVAGLLLALLYSASTKPLP